MMDESVKNLKKGADSDRVRKMLRVDVAFEQMKNTVVANAKYYKGVYAIAVLDNVSNDIEVSVAKAEIANELMDRFNISLEAEDIVSENFNSLDLICNLVSKHV